jgi:hypothetical protein
MRLTGWCERCHRVRLVDATDVNAALAVMRHGTAIGVCDECAEAARPLRAGDRVRLIGHRRGLGHGLPVALGTEGTVVAVTRSEVLVRWHRHRDPSPHPPAAVERLGR